MMFAYVFQGISCEIGNHESTNSYWHLTFELWNGNGSQLYEWHWARNPLASEGCEGWYSKDPNPKKQGSWLPIKQPVTLWSWKIEVQTKHQPSWLSFVITRLIGVFVYEKIPLLNDESTTKGQSLVDLDFLDICIYIYIYVCVCTHNYIIV